MTRQLAVNPRAVAEKTREVITRLRPGATEGHRSLCIRRSADEIRGLWTGARAAVLADIPAADASLEFGPEVRDWGTTVTLHLGLETAVPGVATQALAGKAVRRLKALAETGEMPTTEHNPAYRADAEESTP